MKLEQVDSSGVFLNRKNQNARLKQHLARFGYVIWLDPNHLLIRRESQHHTKLSRTRECNRQFFCEEKPITSARESISKCEQGMQQAVFQKNPLRRLTQTVSYPRMKSAMTAGTPASKPTTFIEPASFSSRTLYSVAVIPTTIARVLMLRALRYAVKASAG